jgi:hypothetical protein
MVTPPKPPGSSTEISPPAAVFEMAPANVLHGAVRLHGFASSPTPDTQVRVACAYAADDPTKAKAIIVAAIRTVRFICLPSRHADNELSFTPFPSDNDDGSASERGMLP